MVFTFFFRKEVWSSWEGSRKHKIYNPTLSTVCMLFENTGWFPSEKLTTTRFIHGLSMTDVWYSRVMLSSSSMPPLASLLLTGAVLSQLRVTHTPAHKPMVADKTWMHMARIWTVLLLSHPWCLLPHSRGCSRAKMSSLVNGFCDTGRQGGVLLELDFGWRFGKSRGD